jgi:hypothetical protein
LSFVIPDYWLYAVLFSVELVPVKPTIVEYLCGTFQNLAHVELHLVRIGATICVIAMCIYCRCEEW